MHKERFFIIQEIIRSIISLANFVFLKLLEVATPNVESHKAENPTLSNKAFCEVSFGFENEGLEHAVTRIDFTHSIKAFV